MNIKNFFSLTVMIILFMISCTDSITENASEDISEEIQGELDISDWSETTHGKGASPNFEIVFTQDQVNRIDLVISSTNWNVMLDDMTSNYGSFGASSGRPGMMSNSVEIPVYVPCSFYFNDIQWYQVGVRFKGNSSLQSSWKSGILKLPLRLNFDRFEDEYPKINNQRFYGFKELSLSNGFEDHSLIREKIVPEIFKGLGIAAPQTAFYRVYIDYGDGPIYFGLYTMVEIVDDTVIEEQFSDDNGNLYKPEGTSASFAENTFNTLHFEKKTNEETDWSDIETVFEVLHSDNRTDNPALWRTTLEQVFNTEVFLKWLAVNTTIQNWDTYGKMTHNYYLYNNPANNQLTWIPWDNNEALKNGKQGGALSISCDEVDESWPLIRYLLDDEIYLNKYKNYLDQVIKSAFEPSKMIAKYQYYQNLIREYVVGPNGEQTDYTFLNSDGDFDSAIQDLITHVNSRYEVVQNYIK